MDSASSSEIPMILKALCGFHGVKLSKIFAIFAFATCCGYHGQVTIMVHCKNQSAPPSIIHVPVEFPFSFPTMSVRLPSCVRPPGAGATTQPFFIRGSSLLPGAAQMFVAVGVMALLYCVLATVVYIFFQHKYLVDNRGPRVDFAVSIAFAALWLSSSLLWARALSELKSTLVPGTLAAPIAACRSQTSTRCSSEAPPIMPALDVSVVGLGKKYWALGGIRPGKFCSLGRECLVRVQGNRLASAVVTSTPSPHDFTCQHRDDHS
uniref:synaptoporin-like isoform X5 n=1 Tax=Myxine glutinosa TaxID=7769 RepID=UPI00359017E3